MPYLWSFAPPSRLILSAFGTPLSKRVGLDSSAADGKELLKGFESITGWFWFAAEKVREQVSAINGKHVKDIICFGFVQGRQ
jgi:hypothetical protein